ncbi:MAG TPA: acyltransferase [Candidatus Acidoferrales bacterium]|jgi:peptidoglycan/LPS O-acetylase OafA/YrhL|nr:acyltransferase [Candidatus Acidoferrales bacterium]
MPTKNSTHTRVFGPDLIRAAAIMLVLMSHTVPGGTCFPVFGTLRGFWGVLGVEIFFMLSGYLIGGILMADLFAGRLDGPSGVVEFWKRRWFRTLPNYYVFLVLTMLETTVLTGRFPAEAGSFVWFGQAMISPYPEFFPAAWSLSVEEWFYLLFPVMLFTLAKVLPRRQQALLATIVVFLVVPVIIRCLIPPTASWDGGIRRVTLPRLDAIGYGVLLVWVKNYGGGVWNFLVRLWPVGVASGVALTVHFCHYYAISGGFTLDSVAYRAFYFNLISVCLVLVFPKVVGMTAPGGWFEKMIRNLSLWSYSMYLSHGIFSGVIAIILMHTGPWHGWEPVIAFPLIWLMTIPGSAFVYRFYERPLMNLRDRPLKEIFRHPR